jgi:hydroxyethylthiazole kinase-like uncharacterized protein yjeF
MSKLHMKEALPVWSRPLLSVAEMRAAEAAAMASGMVAGWTLMSRAGRAVAEAAARSFPPGRARVLCGPGANGGDGYVAARALVEAGWAVEAFGWGDPARAPADAAAARAEWERFGPVRPFGALVDAEPGGLLVDALFGTGAARPLPDAILGPLAAFESRAWGGAWDRLVAVDCPSGLDLDRGRALGVVRPADLTVTFHAPKRGHLIGDGPALCGALVVADIGLPPTPGSVRLGAPDAAVGVKGAAAHKYHHGHAVVVGGGAGRGGAARLAARSALRVGAGLVTLAVPGPAMAENAARLDAVMLRRADDADELAAFLEDARLNAVLLGPGLGVEHARPLVLAALDAGRATVLDADALTAFAGEAEDLAEACVGRDVVLTPHAGEFCRLFPDLADEAARGDRIAAASAAAAAVGACVLLKGPDTIVATPDGAAAVCAAVYDRAAPWLATAGSGDVLAGIIVGLLARGLRPGPAAETAALLHQAAGRAAGAGLIAEDLPEAIPALLRDPEAWGAVR